MPVLLLHLATKRKAIIQNVRISGYSQISMSSFHFRAQCLKHKLLEYEPIIGPGKFDAENTGKAFVPQATNSSFLFTIINDKLLVAFKKTILQYDCIQDLFSAEKFSSYTPQHQYIVQQGDVISLHSTSKLLIVRAEKAIVLYKPNNQNYVPHKVYNYSGIKQLNIQQHTLFICLSDKLVKINLIDWTEQILKMDNNIIAGYLHEDNFYYSCSGSNVIRCNNGNISITLPIQIAIKGIFVVSQYLCVCGYKTNETTDEDDEEPATYSAHVYWFDTTCNQPIESTAHIEIDLIADSNCNGDFGIQQISDLYIVYGSNLRKSTFWKLKQIVEEAKQFSNSDEKLELLQHAEIRGLVCHKLSQHIGFGMNQKNFRCITRNENLLVLDRKGNLQSYEFLDFNNLTDYYHSPSPIQSQLITQSKLMSQSIKLPQFEDIKFTIIENLQNEITQLSNPPYNLTLQLRNNSSSFVIGSGSIDNKCRLNQNSNPSANLATSYNQFQIIGHEREILIFTPLDIQNILLKQPHQFKRHVITQNPNERIHGVYQFQQQLLVQTNESLYLTKVTENIWESKKILTKEVIKRVQINEAYLIIQVSDKTVAYEYVNNCLVFITESFSDAGSIFKYNEQVGLLLLQDEQLFFLKDFNTRQSIQIDIKIKKSTEYCISQLHQNHIYIAFGKYDVNCFEHYILNYDFERNQAKSETHLAELLRDTTINNDKLGEMKNADWNIAKIETRKVKIIIINPNAIQQGIILQICGNDLRTINDDQENPITLPCYNNIVKGISVLNYVLPNETNLGSKPGLCQAKKDSKVFQYQLYPQILLFEYDEDETLTMHRFLLIKIDNLSDEEPLLKTYQEPQKSTVSQVQPREPNKPSSTQSQKSVQPPPSPSQQGLMPPTKVAQITQQLVDFCSLALKQISGLDDQTIFKPYFSMFTPQKFLDECSSKYHWIQNQRRLMIQQTRESSAVKDFCLLRKSFKIPKFTFDNSQLQQGLSQFATVAEQFSWICCFVVETLKMNPIKRNTISFGEFQFPDISHIKINQGNKQRTGRKIAFQDAEMAEAKVETSQLKLQYIQKLCYATKSKVKYLKLETEKQEANDLNIQPMVMSATSFGIPSQRLLQPPVIDPVDEQSYDESKDEVNILQIKSEILSNQNQQKNKKNSNSSLQNDSKGIARTKGGLLNQQQDISSESQQPSKQMSKNPFESDSDSNRVNRITPNNLPIFDPLSESQERQPQQSYKAKLKNTNERLETQEPSKTIFGSLFPETRKPVAEPQKEPFGTQFAGLSFGPAPKQEEPKVDKPSTAPPPPPTTGMFGQLTAATNIFNTIPMSESLTTTQFLGVQTDVNSTPKKETKKPDVVPPQKQTEPPVFSFVTSGPKQEDSQASQNQNTPKLNDLNQSVQQPSILTNQSQSAPIQTQTLPLSSAPLNNQSISFPIVPSQNLFGQEDKGQFALFGTNQPMSFQNFGTQPQQTSSLFQNQQNTPFQGLQNIGISQPKSGALNVNQSSFGNTSSIFNQPSQTSASASQRITFAGLQSQGQNQNGGLPNNNGSLFGQVNQGQFISQPPSFSLGFDPAAEKPRK